MEENIGNLINTDTTILCLFKENFLLELYEDDMGMELSEKDNPEYKGYALNRLGYFLNCCIKYISEMRYPKKYKSMFYDQLDELRSIDDSNRKERNAIINEAMAYLNMHTSSENHYTGFLSSVFDAMSADLQKLDIDEKNKQERLDFIVQSKAELLKIRDIDDPNNHMKLQLYSDVYSKLMPTVEEAEKFKNNESYIGFMEGLADIDEIVKDFKNDGLDAYKEIMQDKRIGYDDSSFLNLDAVIDIIIQWTDYERSILITHAVPYYFNMLSNEVEPFVKSPNYYKTLQKIAYQDEKILQDYNFAYNVRNIFTLREDVDDTLRKELGLLIFLVQENCFEECEQFAINYSKDSKFYKYIKRMIEKYSGLRTNEVFMENVSHVMELNRVRARLSLGKELYNELIQKR